MKPRSLKHLFWLAVITGLLSGVTAGAFFSLTRDLPQIQSLEEFKPSAVTRVYSVDNVLLTEFFIEKRTPVPLSVMPASLISALLTTEDRRFYDHSGIAVKGILRAIIQNIRKRRFAQGASTLTQQLSKTLFLTPRKTILRKMREAVLSLQLERRYTKDEILALYLNQIYFGSGAYGVSAAARIYFDKHVQDLTISQCALLAGLPKAPSRYSPLTHPELAIKRRNVVLQLMRSTGSIDEATYRRARQEKIATPPSTPAGGQAPDFVNYIKKELVSIIGADRLYKGGLTVYTTVSHHLQQTAENAVNQGLTQLKHRMLQTQPEHSAPQGALLSMDVATGAVLAMVGGAQDAASGFNRATSAQRQPGSAFKPIVFALAVERGFQQYQTILDAPVVFESLGRSREDWQPENFSRTYSGEITLRWALARSKNIPAVRLIENIGPSAVIQFAQALGLRSNLSPNLSLALGTSEVNLLELTAAYTVFANRGKYIKPYGVTEVIDSKRKVLWRAKTEQHIAMSRSTAAIVTDMLQSVIDSGTGQGAKSLLGPLAGKTGTTNEFKDALFIGYAPHIAAGVWVGNDDATTLGPGETGAKAALPIWTAFMQEALSDTSQHYFDIPDDVVKLSIHPRTGARLSEESSEAVRILAKDDRVR